MHIFKLLTCLFIVKLSEVFIDSRNKSLIRYMFANAFFHFVSFVFSWWYHLHHNMFFDHLF